jgi:60 kDa SS-A/Ro ribonucleoprotein
MSYASHLGRNVPQTEALPGQVANSGGGFSFAIDDWKRLDRFLILGASEGTYYASEKKLTVENAAVVERCAKLDPVRTVARIIEISHAGRAPKNEPALLALAICAKRGTTVECRRLAYDALPQVARIATHLFHFAEYVKALGGWGRGTRRAVGNWYLKMPVEHLAFQAIKYQQRNGWSHRDLLRKTHPKAGEVTRDSILNWMVKGWPSTGDVAHEDSALVKIWAFERAKTAKTLELVKLISEYGLPHECVPNEAKGDVSVWAAMLPRMGMTAMIRNLGKMTSVGLLKPMSAASRFVADSLADVEAMRRARIHPLSLLVALKVYQQGHGDKGSLTWSPDAKIVDALDAAFYTSFKAVEPTGKRHLLALDVSASMTWSKLAGMPITPREGSAAMALVTANVEPEYAIAGFSQGIKTLSITPRQRLDDVVQYINQQDASSTDCALPMLWALKNKIEVDVFVVYTDNETNGASVHPKIALEQYRQKMGRAAKMVVIGMTATEFSVASPDDAGQMDVVGFDSATPSIISQFVAG